MRRRTALLALALATLTATARADTVILQNAQGGAGQAYNDVRIEDFVDGKLRYITSGGSERSDEAARVYKIAVSQDAVLTAAEEAFVAQQWPKAVEGYQRLARGGQEWKRRWVIPRLIFAANEADRLDAAVTAYVALLRLDPEAARTAKPELPTGPNKILDDAVAETVEAMKGATVPQQVGLLTFQIELHRARNDQPAVAKSLEQLLGLSGELAADPALQSLLAEIRIAQARQAVSQKKYAEAKSAIDSARASIVEPKLAAEALYLLAQAELGLAKPDDKAALKNAALAFMRVVAHFQRVEGRPFVGESLLETARLHARLDEIATARSLYEQLLAEFSGTPVAVSAEAELAKLPQEP